MQQPRSSALTVAVLATAGLAVLAGGAWAVWSLSRPAPSPGASADAPLGLAADGAEIRTLAAALDAARQAMDQDKAAIAEKLLRPAVDRFPGDQRARFMLAECLLQTGDKPGAYEQYERGIMIGPDHAEYRHAAATVAAEIGRLDDAESHYLVAQKLAPSNPKFPLYLAQVQRKQGKTDEARANLMVAAKLDPSLAIAWASLAAIALDENRPSVAHSYITRARELEPDRLEWRLVEAKALRRDNQPREALALLLAIPEKLRATDAATLEELALCHGMLDDPASAAALYTGAISAGSDDPEMGYQAAVWLARARQNQRAAMYAQHAAAKGHEGAKKLLAQIESEPDSKE